jgi:hypothetical protein
MLKATEDEIEEVREYLEWQASDLEVTFMKKVYKVCDALFRIEDRQSFQSGRRIEGIGSWARSSKPNSHGSA